MSQSIHPYVLWEKEYSQFLKKKLLRFLKKIQN